MKLLLCVNWTAIGVIASTVLSIILVITGVLQYLRHSKLEKDIASRDNRISLYQYRFQCYAKVIKTHSLLLDLGGHKFISDDSEYIDKQIADKLINGRNLIFSAYLESRLLFSNKVSEKLKKLNEVYGEIFESAFMMLSDDKSRMDEVKRVLITECYNVDALLALPQKIFEVGDVMNTARESIYLIFPEIKKYNEAYNRFIQILDSQEFEDLINEYMNIRDADEKI